MKILFYNYALNMGGIERTITSISEELSKEHTVLVLQYTADEAFYTLSERVGYYKLGFTAGGNRLFRTVKLFFSLRRFLRTHRPDVVFCMNKTHLPLFCLAARGICPVIGAERSNPLVHMSRRECRLREMSARADGFVFQTQRARAVYPDATQKKSVVIPNAICNPDVLLPAPATKKAGFVTVGRLEYVKGYDLLLCAYRNISEKLPDWDLHIFGEGKCREALTQQISSLGLENRVHLYGADDHAFLKAREFEAFVLSSRSEGMPNALLEALAAGMACVSFDCPNGPSELIQDGKNGLLVPAADVEAMSEALYRLAQDSDLRASLGASAACAKDTFSPAAISARWLEYAKSVLKQLSEKRSLT